MTDLALQAWQVGRAWNKAAGVPKHPFPFSKVCGYFLITALSVGALAAVVQAIAGPKVAEAVAWLLLGPILLALLVRHHDDDKRWKAQRDALRQQTPRIGGR